MGPIRLDATDRLFFYTDGASEAMNPDGEEFGEQRIFQFLTSCDHDSCGGIVRSLEEKTLRFHGKQHLEDDCTMLLALVRPESVTDAVVRENSLA